MNTLLTISILFVAALGVFLAGILWARRVWRRRTAAGREREATRLRELYGLSLQDTQSVLNGQTTPAALHATTWERAIATGVDFATVQQSHKGQEPASTTRPKPPLRLRPMSASKSYHVSEAVHGASPDISGYVADVWFYLHAGKVSHVVLAGHTNGPVCRQITGLIMNTFLASQQPAEALLVPGACLLRAPVALSQVAVNAPPEIKGNLLIRFGPPPPLDVLRGDLGRMDQPTGLIHLYDVTDMPYDERRNRLLAELKAAYKPQRSVLVSRSRGSQPLAIFMPYFDLRQADAQPLVFTLPLSLFDCDEYRQLVNIHEKALHNELIQDAHRRKQIYQEWLKADEDLSERYRSSYQRMTPGQQKAKEVRIGGRRNYLTATVEGVSEDSSEAYISPHEYVENVLPALLREDRSWIGQMDKLMENLLSGDPFREQALREVNLGTLIDSFLRGWPSVFLSGVEAKSSYDKWCERKREFVWTYLHALLARQDLRIEPLQEHNTFFHVKRLDDTTIQMTPLHALDEGEFLVFLSPDYGLPFYVDRWQRRKVTYTPRLKDEGNNALQAKRCLAEAEQLLDQPSPSAPPEAIAKLRQALIYHPFVAASAFWDGWWRRFARDTRSEFDTFQEMMRAIRAFNNHEEPETIITHIHAFVQRYPNSMPDPYLLLAYMNVYERLGLRPLESEKARLVARSHELDRLLRGKRDYLDSNKGNVRSGSSRDLDILRVEQEVSTLTAELQSNQQHVEQLNTAIEQQRNLLWNTLAEPTVSEMASARRIDAAFVERFLRERQLRLSPAYHQRYEPLHSLLKGDEYVAIANTLYSLSVQLSEKKLDLDALKESVSHCLDVKYVDRTELKQIEGFAEGLKQMAAMDAVLREMRIRQDLDEMVKTYFEQGQKLYDSCVTLLPEFTEPLKRIVARDAVNRRAYRKSIQQLPNLSVPLCNFAPKAQFASLTDKPFGAARFEFRESDSCLVAFDENGTSTPIASITGLTEEEEAHLKMVIAQDAFVRQVSLGLTPAQAVLNHRIPPNPLSARWSQAALALEPWFVQLMAYLGIFPAGDTEPPSEEALSLYEAPAVEAVDFSLSTVASTFLAENRFDPAKVVIVSI